MKKYIKLYSALLVSSLCLFASCAKEDNQFTNNGNGGKNGIVELYELMPRSSATAYANATQAFAALPEVDVPITVNYTGVNGAPEDVTVTWDFNNAAVTTLAAANIPVPSNMFTAPEKIVVIPKGKKTATIILKVKTNLFDTTKRYGFGIQLKTTSMGTISGNYGTGVYYVTIKK